MNGNWNRKLWLELAARYGCKPDETIEVTCHLCGAKGLVIWWHDHAGFKGLEVDHIKPKSRGGTEDLDNLMLTCPKCNRGRCNRSVEEYVNSEAFLSRVGGKPSVNSPIPLNSSSPRESYPRLKNPSLRDIMLRIEARTH